MHLLLLCLSGCLLIGRTELDARIDADGDGFIAVELGGDDCDDQNASVSPGATDAPYDGVDSDCDGRDDFDADRDGLAAAAFGGDDCDDTSPLIGADPGLWAADCDGDGVGQANSIESCGAPTGRFALDTAGCRGGEAPTTWLRFDPSEPPDCDDDDRSISPRIVDTPYDGIDSDCGGGDDFDADGDGFPVDQDCDDLRSEVHPGAVDLWYDGVDSDCDGQDDFDQDGDGHPLSTDCLDTDPAVHPGAPEVWYDGVDQDCDGSNDFDADGDGFALVGATPLDCDDLDATVHPGGTEVWYDGVDGDCDGANDYDADHDGFVAEGHGDQRGGSAPESGDCDDNAAGVNPGRDEQFYDGLDEDCAGDNDFDADGDGHVAIGYEAEVGGTALFVGDCADDDSTRNPGVPELYYDGVDSDCGGGDDYDADGDGVRVDLDCDDADPDRAPGLVEVYYDGVDGDCLGGDDFDADGDGVPVALDCDDTDASRAPGRFEVAYDGVDSNCDGANDYDVDGDGFVSSDWPGTAGGTALSGGDCDDFDASIHPDATEVPYDGVDSDCDGLNDYDADGDGVVENPLFAGGSAPMGGDCDDADASVAPGLVDIWYDGVDSDCDGANDFDRDGDGVVRVGNEAEVGGTAVNAGDCDDGDPAIHAGAPDFWYDGIDSACDGGDDFDQDGDGFVWDAFGGLDCDDLDPAVNPAASDLSGVDRNCDGQAIEDVDGDGVAAADDCDEADPTRWIGGSYVLQPTDALEERVQRACDGTTFEVPEGTWKLGATVVVDRPLDFVGPGHLVANGVRAFEVLATASITGLTLSDGLADEGGCLRVGASLALQDVRIEHCESSGAGGAIAVLPTGTLTAMNAVFVNNLAENGGAIHALGPVTIVDSAFQGDQAFAQGGALHVEGTQVSLTGLQVLSAQADNGAALSLVDVGGRIEDLLVVAAIAPNVFNERHGVLYITGGTGVLELEHVRIRGSVGTSGLLALEHRGLLTMHDLDVGFHVGRHAVEVYSEQDSNDLQIDNLFVHDHSNAGSTATPVTVYAVLGFDRDWRLQNATITRNGGARSLFVGCHFCGVFEVRNLLTGSELQFGQPAGLMWIDTFDEMAVSYTTTLYDRPWLEAYSGPEGRPLDCVSCGQTVAHPFRVQLPGADVHLDPSGSLVGTGDPALCIGSLEPACQNPGFWGGPNPPQVR